MKYILLIGATGVFGSRLARLLWKENDLSITLAGRTQSSLQQMAQSGPEPAAYKVMDRNHIKADDLREFDLVIDTAGPFQTSNNVLIEAAISAKTNYMDIADGREFIKDIGRYDKAAKAAGIFIISGASSIPALSHAVIDTIVKNWSTIDTIRVGIFPGNRAPRGLSVVEAILSYVGKPVRVYKDAMWQNHYGWGMTHRIDFPHIGKRWASVCDTPEQDLLVARYKPKQSAQFFAGMELSIMHLGLLLLSMPVRWGWIISLRPYSQFLLWIAKLLLPFGSDKGAMHVHVAGQDAHGIAQDRRWILEANANKGPNVPIIAALIIARKFVAHHKFAAGAMPCSGILELQDFTDDFERMNIRTMMQDNPN